VEFWQIPVLIAGGFLCGVINALAGGGSFLTLPLLFWIGLPPQVANATNRVAIVLQCVTGIAAYQRKRVLPWGHLPALAVPTVLGALLGAYLAAHVDETLFRRAAAVLFAIMAATVFVDPGRWARRDSLAAGSMAGGYVGAHLVMAKGSPWVRAFVVLAAAAAIAKLLLGA